MFAQLFALLFNRKKPDPVPTLEERLLKAREGRAQRIAEPIRPMGKARTVSAAPAPGRQPDDILSNPLHPLHPLNPFNPIGFNSPTTYDSTETRSDSSSCSYDGGSSSSSSSYDSGSSCDSSSSSSFD